MKYLIKENNSNLDIEEIATKCECYVFKDFEIMIQLATHQVLVRNGQNLKDEDFYNTINKYVPLSLRSVKQDKTDIFEWARIGGINIKNIHRYEESQRGFD